jgi:uncharacterized membrane protein YkvA (DUF1232 family)
MAVRSSRLSFPGFSLFRALSSHVRLTVRLLREPAVPLLTKVLPVAAVLYLISPLDFVPDILPILGQLDDAGVLLLALESFLKLCPEHAVAFHREAMSGGRPYSPMPASGVVIDAEFRREDDGR